MPLTIEAENVISRLYDADTAQRAAGLPPSLRTRNIDRESGRFLHLLVRATKATRILEIGSSNGLSTIWLASAVAENGGQLVGTELLTARAAEANANLADAGLAGVARVVAGDARLTVASLSGPFDLVFIDAEKDDYLSHFAAVFGKVRSCGLIVADNVVSHDLTTYQAMLRVRGDLQTVTLPLERGLELTLKH